MVVAAIAASLMTVTTGCQHLAPASSAEIEPDSLTGVVSITGTAFEQRLVLRSDDRVTPLSAGAPDSAALSRMGGVEVLAIGKRTPDHFRVARFVALNVAGSPVVDGFVRNDGGRLVLETADGLLALGNPPAALRGMVGARVWISGPLDTGPNSYGVIVRAR